MLIGRTVAWKSGKLTLTVHIGYFESWSQWKILHWKVWILDVDYSGNPLKSTVSCVCFTTVYIVWQRVHITRNTLQCTNLRTSNSWFGPLMPGPSDEKLIVQWSDRNSGLKTLLFWTQEFDGTPTMNSSQVSKHVAFLESWTHQSGWNRCGSALLSIRDQNRENNLNYIT